MNIKCCMNCRTLDCQFLFFFQEKMVEQGHRHINHKSLTMIKAKFPKYITSYLHKFSENVYYSSDII